jgi:hypothetical protein
MLRFPKRLKRLAGSHSVRLVEIDPLSNWFASGEPIVGIHRRKLTRCFQKEELHFDYHFYAAYIPGIA